MSGSITDVGGILVGHHQRLDPDVTLGSGWACGTTVVLAPPGTTGAVDVRGGAPGSRETDLLDPANSVRYVDAVVLTGGSAYGLAAADGVMGWLEAHDRGIVMDGGLVPIVPAAVIFDLPVGGWECRPTAEFGYAAAEAACVGRRGRNGRRGRGRTRWGAQRWRRDGVDHARGDRRHGRRGRRRQLRGQHCRPFDRPAVDGVPDPRVRTRATACRPDCGLRAARRRAVAVEHHDRRRCHRRRAEPRRVQAPRHRRAGRAGAHHPAVHTPRSTATRCSRWPPASWKCPPDATTPAGCRRRRR